MTLPGIPLLQSDLDALARAGIDPEIANRAMLRRVDTFDGARLVGRNGSADYAGIAIPNIWPGQEHVREYRLRRDHPEMEQVEGGRLKEKNKYLSPPGRGNILYVPPGITPEWLADTSIPVILTEGEKKSLALWGLAWCNLGDAADRPRFLPLALPGVWNFRGTIGKTESADGTRVDEKGVIPDFSRIPWKGRESTILFDRNVHWKEDVQWARTALAAELRRRSAHVLFVDLPQDMEINGVDDLIGHWGAERVLDFLKSNAYNPRQRHRTAKSDT